MPGRAVAVKVQDRTCQFLLISVYIHPEHRKQDAEALLRAWRRLDRANQFVFLTEISTVLIPTSRTSGSKFYYSLNVLMLIRH